MNPKLKQFTYKFNDGPLATETELLSDWNSGNCRRAIQYYIYKSKKVFLEPEDVLCPKSYNEIGTFVVTDNNNFSFNQLTDGDIIYAEKVSNRNGVFVDKSLSTFSTNDEYITALHTAMFTGEKNKEIWHATAIEGSSCYWSLDKFLKYYKVIAAKRINTKL